MSTTLTHGTVNTTPATNFDVAVPAHTAGDMLVLRAAKNQGASSSPAISTAGWTVEVDLPDASATNHVLLAWKIGDGSETIVRLTGMAGGTVMGRVTRVEGSDGTVYTPDSDTGSDVETVVLDVGTCAAGDAGFSVVCQANTQSSLAATNGYTIDNSNTLMGIASKVLTTADESTKWTWTTSRSYRAGLLVVRAAVAADLSGVTRAPFGITATVKGTKGAPSTTRPPVAITARTASSRASTGRTSAPVTVTGTGSTGTKNATGKATAMLGATALGPAGGKATGGTTSAPTSITALVAGAKDAVSEFVGSVAAHLAVVATVRGAKATTGRARAPYGTPATVAGAKGARATVSAPTSTVTRSTGAKGATGTVHAPPVVSSRSSGARGALGRVAPMATIVARARGAKGATGGAAGAVTVTARALGGRGTSGVVAAITGWWATVTGSKPRAGGCMHYTVATPTITAVATTPTIAALAATPTMTATAERC